MKKILVFVLMTSLVTPMAYGQIGSATANNENIRDLAANDATMTIRTFDNRYEGIKGHPFIYEDWLLGELITTDGSRYKEVKLKYNIHKDEVSIKKASNEVLVLFNEHVVTFVIAGTPFKKIKDSDGSRFYEVLSSGAHNLLARREKKLLKADYEGAYSAGRTSDEFADGTTKYFIQKGELAPMEIKLNSKSISKALGVVDKEIRSEIKANRYNLKVERDLINLVASHSNQTL